MDDGGQRVDTTTDQIKREIEEARERISDTTSRIGERIRSTFDWRQQVAEHPWAAVGLVAGAGLVIGAAAAKTLRGGARAVPSYGEQHTDDRIASDVESQSSGMGDGGSAWLRGGTTAAAGWMGGRSKGGPGRSGAIAGLIASLGATFQPQLQEIGRNLAEQLKDLSNHLIGQGKETLKSKVDEWRSGSQGGQGSRGWPTTPAGGSTLSSESAGAWPSGSTTGSGAASGSTSGTTASAGGTAGSTAGSSVYGSATSPGVEDTRDTRTPQSRESAAGERRAGGGSI